MSGAPSHLHRREVIAVFLDWDEAALSGPDSEFQLFSASGEAAIGSVGGTSSYRSPPPPAQEGSLLRAALVTFMEAKLSSVADASLLSFRVYVVRDSPRAESGVMAATATKTKYVVELWDGGTDIAGGHGIQASVRQLANDLPVLRNRARETTSSSIESYGSVVDCLKQLLAKAIRPVRPPPRASEGRVARRIPSMRGDTAGTNCEGSVVVHGVVLRCQSCPLMPPPSPPSPLRLSHDGSLSAAIQGSDTDNSSAAKEASQPACWLDILSVTPLTSSTTSTAAPPSSAADGAAAPVASSPRASFTFVLNGCNVAVLDPAELTGICHRRMALGPGLVRLIALQEGRGPAFMDRRLTYFGLPNLDGAPMQLVLAAEAGKARISVTMATSNEGDGDGKAEATDFTYPPSDLQHASSRTTLRGQHSFIRLRKGPNRSRSLIYPTTSTATNSSNSKTAAAATASPPSSPGASRAPFPPLLRIQVGQPSSSSFNAASRHASSAVVDTGAPATTFPAFDAQGSDTDHPTAPRLRHSSFASSGAASPSYTAPLPGGDAGNSLTLPRRWVTVSDSATADDAFANSPKATAHGRETPTPFLPTPPLPPSPAQRAYSGVHGSSRGQAVSGGPVAHPTRMLSASSTETYPNPPTVMSSSPPSSPPSSQCIAQSVSTPTTPIPPASGSGPSATAPTIPWDNAQHKFMLVRVSRGAFVVSIHSNGDDGELSRCGTSPK